MSEYKDFSNMIDIISYALEIQGRAEESFRRSAKNATSSVARDLFSEIADDFGSQREKLQIRKNKLSEALIHLWSVEQDFEHKIDKIITVPVVNTSESERFVHAENNTQRTARDPVCDMQVDTEETSHVTIYRNEKYFFCCEDCQKAFELAPSKYLQPIR